VLDGLIDGGLLDMRYTVKESARIDQPHRIIDLTVGTPDLTSLRLMIGN